MTSTPVSTPRPSHKAPPAQPIKLYRSVISGHSHRVELFLSLLGLPVECVDIDLATKGHKTSDFLAMNAFGQVPVIQDGDITLADSNAILVYLTGRYADDADFMDKHCRLMSIRKQVRDRLKRKRPVKKPKRKVKSKRSRK